MTDTTHQPRCPHPACPQAHIVKNGTRHGKQRYRCQTCGRSFGETTGTPMYRLQTPVAEVAQALLIVMRRGSLRAAEAITQYKYETVSGWVHRAAAHAESLTEVFVRDLHLRTVEIDEFWSFVRKKTASPRTERRGTVGLPRARSFQSLHRGAYEWTYRG